MEDEYFEKMVDHALYQYETSAPNEIRRQVKRALREVERDTRHKAGELAHKLANDIHNMQHKV